MSRRRQQEKEGEEEMMQEEAEEEELEVSYHSVDLLEKCAITAADVGKLKVAGFYTVESVLMATKKTLCNVKGMSEAKIDKVAAACKSLLPEYYSFKTGAQVMVDRGSVVKISTGSKALDELLGGGVETMSLTEVFGEFRTGRASNWQLINKNRRKTQLCHTLCVTAQLPHEMGGGNGRVIYIDTEGTFRPENIVKISDRFGLDSDAVLDNILVARPHNHEHQLDMIHQVAAKVMEEPHALLIIDSFTALFRVDFSGRGELADRQQKMAQMLKVLAQLSCQFGMAIFYTNQVTADPGGGAMFMASVAKPIGGNILGHASTTRLSLRKGKGETRICKIYDSPSLPESDCTFAITSGGIADAE